MPAVVGREHRVGVDLDEHGPARCGEQEVVAEERDHAQPPPLRLAPTPRRSQAAQQRALGTVRDRVTVTVRVRFRVGARVRVRVRVRARAAGLGLGMGFGFGFGLEPARRG